MKYILSALLVVLGVICLGFHPAAAQPGDTVYVAVDRLGERDGTIASTCSIRRSNLTITTRFIYNSK